MWQPRSWLKAFLADDVKFAASEWSRQNFVERPWLLRRSQLRQCLFEDVWWPPLLLVVVDAVWAGPLNS